MHKASALVVLFFLFFTSFLSAQEDFNIEEVGLLHYDWDSVHKIVPVGDLACVLTDRDSLAVWDISGLPDFEEFSRFGLPGRLTVNFTLPKPANVRLQVIDTQGCVVHTALDDFIASGGHKPLSKFGKTVCGCLLYTVSDSFSAHRKESGVSQVGHILKRIVMRNKEIFFQVETDDEGCYITKALGYSIITQADDLPSLGEMIKDTVFCHFEDVEMPKIISFGKSCQTNDIERRRASLIS